MSKPSGGWFGLPTHEPGGREGKGGGLEGYAGLPSSVASLLCMSRAAACIVQHLIYVCDGRLEGQRQENTDGDEGIREKKEKNQDMA